MKTAAFILFVVFVFNKAQCEVHYDKPHFVLDPNQPEDKSFIIRLYSPTMWVRTTFRYGTQERLDAYTRLNQYFSGSNDQGENIPMGLPVITDFNNRLCAMCWSRYALSIYLPPKYQRNPPAPSNLNVTVVQYPATKMYIREFFEGPRAYQYNAELLHDDLLRNGITDDMIVTEKYYGGSFKATQNDTVGYHEVWIEETPY